MSVEEAISEPGLREGRGITWAVLHLRCCPDLTLSCSRLRLVRELKDRLKGVSGLARAAVREISGVQLLEQKSAASSVLIEPVSMEEEPLAGGTD